MSQVAFLETFCKKLKATSSVQLLHVPDGGHPLLLVLLSPGEHGVGVQVLLVDQHEAVAPPGVAGQTEAEILNIFFFEVGGEKLEILKLTKITKIQKFTKITNISCTFQ